MKPLISCKEAEQKIMASIENAVLPTEKIPFREALTRTLAKEVLADRDAPPFDRVMMDGICINTYNHKLGSWRYQITGTQAAGAEKMILPKGEYAIEVMTGAVLPTDADCVIPVERIDTQDGYALPHDDTEAEVGQFIHKQGSDCKKGAVVLEVGRFLGAAELAVAASVGVEELEVYCLPNAHLITTGDEVIDPSEKPTDYQIRRSHPTAIRNTLAGLVDLTEEHISDDEVATEEVLKSVLTESNNDVLILTGGISMGKFDWVAPVLEKLLGEAVFHGVAQRPGKPFAFWAGSDSSPHVFALPGNPVSVMATLHRYVLPVLKQLNGRKNQLLKMPLAEKFTWDASLTGILPYKSNNGTILPYRPKNSGDYLALVGADGFVELPPCSENKAGDSLHCY